MSKNRMTFKQYGRSYHLKIDTAEDLAKAIELDEALLVATNAPVNGINCDSTFLQLLDTDKNGRITCREVKEGIQWLLSILLDCSAVDEHSQTLVLDAVNVDPAEGQKIRNAGLKILKRLGQSESRGISLDQVRQVKAREEATPVSEAGVVLPQAADDEPIRQFIVDIIATIGGAPHPGGEQGLSSDQLQNFLSEASTYLDWYNRGVIPDGADKTGVMPFGPETPAAYALLMSIRGKVDQYFAQCQALAIDERFVQRMGWTDDELQDMDFDDPKVLSEVLKKAPLARASAAGKLNFNDKINPCYAQTLKRFQCEIVKPVLEDTGNSLSAEQWQKIKELFAAHHEWAMSKKGAPVEPLGVEKIQRYLDDAVFADAVRVLIAESSQTAFVLDNIRLIEKLILYQKYMIDFANNFVSFPHLYDVNSRAMFEMGTLVIDGRRFNLAVKAENRAQHAEMAKTSNVFVLYIEIAPRDNQKHFEVAVPVTSGGGGNLYIGKRGVFYDIYGNECDAKVVAIIENPISFGEALLSPFRRIGKLMTGKLESLTTAAEKKLDAKTTVVMDKVATKPSQPQTVQKERSGIHTASAVMGAGVAVAALGSAVAYITKTLASVNPLTIVAGVLGAILIVMLPMSIVAFLKLRKRNLSAILEGSGWGINAKMRLTRKQAHFFTERPRYPKGSKGAPRRAL